MPALAPPRRPAFTLIELLVVIAIISSLIAILMPALSGARASSKLSVCLSNLREVGLGVQNYSLNNDGAIPRGPNTPLPYYPAQNWDDWASNQIWIGGANLPNALGTLLAREMKQPKVLYCPADDSGDPSQELAKLDQHQNVDTFCSYIYRQRDEASRDRFDSLGLNSLGLNATALAFDINSQGGGTLSRTNHNGKKVDIVYLDGHAQTAANTNDVFTLRQQDYAGFPTTMVRRLRQVVVNADFAEHGDPNGTPAVP